MENVIGELAHEHGVPLLSFEDLTQLGKQAIAVYGLHHRATKITFAEICCYIIKFISTPFGLNALKNLQ
jgi:hypothetical protein